MASLGVAGASVGRGLGRAGLVVEHLAGHLLRLGLEAVIPLKKDVLISLFEPII